MNPRLRHAAHAWVFSVLFFLSGFSTRISPAGEWRLISPVPVVTQTLAALARMLFVAFLFGGILVLLRRLPSWRITQWILFAAIPVFLVVRLRPAIPNFPHPFAHSAPYTLLLAGVCVFLLVRKSPHTAVRIKNAVSSLSAALAIFAIIITGELALNLFWRPGPQQFSHISATAQDATRPRLVWIVFDELDYNQTFGHRDPSLQLPNFDALRSQSVLYDDVAPVTPRTVTAIPSFLGGSPVDATRYTRHNRLFVKLRDTGKYRFFDPNETLFGTAHRAGLRISIAGWAIPYCTIFLNVADQCYVVNHDVSLDGARLSPDDSFLHDFGSPLHFTFLHLFTGADPYPYYRHIGAVKHAQSVDELTARSLQIVKQSPADVIYLHLPVPHLPSVWDRKTRQFSDSGDYLDSLAQADDILGRILTELKSQPRWQFTTVIIQGDHGWRDWHYLGRPQSDTARWQASPKDMHPLLLVHHAGETAPQTDSAPHNIMVVRDPALAAIQQAAH